MPHEKVHARCRECNGCAATADSLIVHRPGCPELARTAAAADTHRALEPVVDALCERFPDVPRERALAALLTVIRGQYDFEREDT